MHNKSLSRIINSKFLNKLFFAYTIIIVLTLTFLTYIFSSSFASMIKDQSISFNKQVVETVNTYFQHKCSNMKLFHQNIFKDKDLYDSMNLLIHSNWEDNQIDFMQLNNEIEDKLINLALSMDPDINKLYVYSSPENTLFSFYNNPEPQHLLNVLPEDISSRKEETSNVTIFPVLRTYNDSKSASSYAFSVCDLLRDKNDISNILGSIVFDYNCNSIKKTYSQYTRYLKGAILILNNKGDVVFDSSGKYYGGTYPEFEQINNSKSGSLFFENKIVNLLENSKYGFITIGEIPYSELYKDINSTKRKIYTFSLGSVIVILVLTYLSNTSISRRIKKIINSIKSIKGGNLDIKIEPVPGKDEIGMISSNLNEMCQRLKEHIQNEYILDLNHKELELKQKESELYALQAQVNPHFLYNTLEVIRMKALTYKQNEVSDMILILSELFRTSIKEQMVVKIKDEIDYCKAYLELYKIRYGDTLMLSFKIDEEILEFGIVKHLLQPIIENSLTHGINLDWDSDFINRVEIMGYRSGEDIIITVSDNGSGLDECKLEEIENDLKNLRISNGKIGLSNVNYRIKLLYGDGFGLKITSQKGKGTTVLIKIKALTTKELELHV